MTHVDQNSKQRTHLTILGIVWLAIVCLGLLVVGSASAAYQQVGTFAGSATPLAEGEEFSEEVQLGGVGGMAVNYTGAGGVPAGSVYAATYSLIGGFRISLYEPSPDGGLEFEVGWVVPGAEGNPYQRCGPLVGTSCPPKATSGAGLVDVDVDQATGKVYAFDQEIATPGAKVITVFDSTGAEELSRFGVRAQFDVTTASTPSEIHTSNQNFGSLAVAPSGDVYLFDQNFSDHVYNRLMHFSRTSTSPLTYEYAGEIVGGRLEDGFDPSNPVVDASGRIYTVGQGINIEVRSLANPTNSPICSFAYTKGAIVALTVNPSNGEVFFSSTKAPRRVRRLGPCNPATGEFTELAPELEALNPQPARSEVYALAFDPNRQLAAGRPPGVLYGGAPGAAPDLGTAEPGTSSLGYIFAHPAEFPPSVESQSVSHVTTESAVVDAIVNPNGFTTTYVVQYLSAAQYDDNPAEDKFANALEAPGGGATIPSGSGGKSIAVPLESLTADTAFRYRVIAKSECGAGKVCEDVGDAFEFRTYAPEASLPAAKRRAYELVSPPEKDGGQVLPVNPGKNGGSQPGQNYRHGPIQVAPGGDGIAYEGTPFSATEGGIQVNAYVAHRDGTSGWGTSNPTPNLIDTSQGYKAFATDLSSAVLTQSSSTLSPSAPAGTANVYLQSVVEASAFTPLVADSPSHRAPAEFRVRFAAATPDLSRVFFEANDALTPASATAPAAVDGGASAYNLYEWERATGSLRLVNVLPGNGATGPWNGLGPGRLNAISADGSRVVWTAASGQVYVREASETTTAVTSPGKYLAASADGTRVLLDDGCRFDLATASCEDLTENQAGASQGGFKGLSGKSADLSQIYFVDTKVLTGEESNSEGATAEDGESNLYSWTEGEPRFVATLEEVDTDLPIARDWNPDPSLRTAQASPEGRFLAFESEARLTGYDNTGLCKYKTAGNGEPTHYVPGPCTEVFLYDSLTGTLSCASCNPSGALPISRSWAIIAEDREQTQYVTDDGRLFFDSKDSLVPSDTNAGVEDVYQFQPDGAGDCDRPVGCLALISAGTGTAASNFLAIDADGKNVFFTSRDRLVAKDKDDLIDLYDAREGGGIPGDSEVPSSECQGEACQPTTSAPSEPMPSSATFQGTANVTAQVKKCRKGKVLRKGKCVKRHQKGHRKAHKNQGGRK